MRVEILTIGNELLAGDITDTNSVYLSQSLAQLGYEVTHHSSVRDDEIDMHNAMALAASRSEVVFVSGGLGPTSDDFTLDVAAKVFGVGLEFHLPTVQKLQAWCEKRGRVLTEANKKQALLPIGALVLPNDMGTAPGVEFLYNRTTFYFLPGVPKELKHIYEMQILPKIQSRTQSQMATAVLKCFGMAESDMQMRLADLFEDRVYIEGVKVAFRVAFPDVYLKLTAMGESASDAQAKLNKVKTKIYDKLGEVIYSEEPDETLESQVIQKYSQMKKTLAVSESCTGGLISHRLTNVSGSSLVFLAGLTTYANDVKQSVLQVPQDVFIQHGAVSAECATAMVQGLKHITNADVCVATTGIAGPGGGTDDKPQGTVFVAILSDTNLSVQKHFFPFSRDMFKQYVASTVLKALKQKI